MEKLLLYHFNDLLNEFKTPSAFATHDSKENDEDYELKLNVAGLGRKDIDLSVEDNKLVVKSNNDDIFLDKKFELPRNVNEERIKAEVSKGLLKVIIPKKDKVKIQIE